MVDVTIHTPSLLMGIVAGVFGLLFLFGMMALCDRNW